MSNPYITVTYSPSDNKLRLTSTQRLDPETYARVRATGFKWAPKLEQFIAPMWTPEREDLAIVLSTHHEIMDEDATPEERAAIRAERFEGYSERRGQEAEQAYTTVHAISDRFEMGQPIICGHHSEKRARKDKERIESGMRKAVDLWKTSTYWKERAEASIRHAQYTERPDVRARRIKGLEADKRKREREKAEAEGWLKLWNTLTDENEGLNLDRARAIANRCNLQACTTTDEHGRTPWSAWAVLQPDGERFARCPSMSVSEVKAAANVAYPRLIANRDRWINHYANRIVYEDRMLDVQGGYEIPRNRQAKTDLPLLNYAGEISYRSPYNNEITTTTTTPMTKAEYASIPADYKGTRVSACGTHRVRTAMQRGKHMVVWLSDSKQHSRPAQIDVENKKVEERAEKATADEKKMSDYLARQEARDMMDAKRSAEDARGSKFKKLAQQVKTGVEIVVADQLFVTPAHVADQMVELAELKPGNRIGELSAGTGNIVKAVERYGDAREINYEVVMVEIDPKLCMLLERTGHKVICADFLECVSVASLATIRGHGTYIGSFDRIIINPPFANGSDIEHILYALTLLRPHGILVALCAGGPRQRDILQPLALDSGGEWIDLPQGTFKESGTMVNVSMMVIRK